jgi:hypothetical protein
MTNPSFICLTRASETASRSVWINVLTLKAINRLDSSYPEVYGRTELHFTDGTSMSIYETVEDILKLA